MGIYDRQYSRGPEQGIHLSAPRTATMQIVVACALIYVAQIISSAVTEALVLPANWPTQPWRAVQLLTYGFLHSPNDTAHILINMVVLWMFGTEVERRYGRREFLTFYLTAIVFSGLIWSLIEWSLGEPMAGTSLAGEVIERWSVLLGASGAISAVLVLFALNFPHRQVLFMFFIPMPMWVLAVIALMMDASGAISRGAISRSGNVAYTAHLAGALYGFCYFRYGWAPGRWLTDRLSGLSRPRGPKLRVHRPDPSDELSQQVDQILAKIQTQGQDSLSRKERKILERASREYQQKRK